MQEKLTPREQDILNLLLEGTSPKEIGYKLNISYHTVDFHRTKIYRKLGVKNIHELLSTYGRQSTAAISEEPAVSPWEKSGKRFKLLISAATLILAVSILSLWIFLLKHSADNSENTVTIRNDETGSIAGTITFENGTAFITRPINTVYLKANRYSFLENGYLNYGENYNSHESVLLKDVYNNGSLDDLIPEFWQTNFVIRLSGTVDVELKYFLIDLQYFFKNVKNDNSAATIHLGGSTDTGSGRSYYPIGPGEFSAEIPLVRSNVNLQNLPEGEVLIQLVNVLQWHSENPDNIELETDNGAIPENIPQNTIMATIRNLVIEPILYN